jgi:hypothetical protein
MCRREGGRSLCLPAPRRGIDIASWLVPETSYGHAQLLKLAKWGGWRRTERPRYAQRLKRMVWKPQLEFLVQKQTRIRWLAGNCDRPGAGAICGNLVHAGRVW